MFFQRPKPCGGGFWLGKTEDGFFLFGIEWPVSLADGMTFLMARDAEEMQRSAAPENDPNYSFF